MCVVTYFSKLQVSSIATRTYAGRLGNRRSVLGREKFFSFPRRSHQPSSPFFPLGKRVMLPAHKADHSPLSTLEIENTGSYTTAPPRSP